MEISDRVHCLFSATVEERDGSYVLEVPKRELEAGEIDPDGTYRVAMLPSSATASSSENREGNEDSNRGRSTGRRTGSQQKPPVEEGETRTVEIEDIGDQGDGITRVERGFVVIVPDTDQGERVAVEITDVQENVAFGEVTERISYYE
jgi:predicted RNA-binding protein with TRAM domain